jgi:hypothetical protein
MHTLVLDAPEFGFIVGTRAALAAGIALLAAGSLPAERRRAIGAALVAIGAATTIPAAMFLVRGRRRGRRRGSPQGEEFDADLRGAPLAADAPR